jgi:hypothetical protein
MYGLKLPDESVPELRIAKGFGSQIAFHKKNSPG